MKSKNIFYLFVTIIAIMIIIKLCDNSKNSSEIKKRELAKLNELELQKKIDEFNEDEIKYEEALALKKQQKWDEAITAFKEVKLTKKYRKYAAEHINEIRNRPWQKSNGYIKAQLNGEFSNSATKNSPLWIEVLISNDYIFLYMYEYSTSKPANRSAIKPSYDFSIYASGYKDDYLCYNIRPSDNYEVGSATHSEGIRILGGLHKKVINMLKKSGGKVYFSITMGSSSTYQFYLNSDGFTKALNGL